jgi:hypothetical protein
MRRLTNPLLLVAMTLVCSCSISVKPGYFADDQKMAEQAVNLFHARLSSEKYEEIYEQTADALLQTANKSDLILSMKQTHDTFGAFIEAQQSGANVIMGTPRQVRLVYNTKYAKGDAAEQFMWLVDGNEAQLALYKISPGTVKPSTEK